MRSIFLCTILAAAAAVLAVSPAAAQSGTAIQLSSNGEAVAAASQFARAVGAQPGNKDAVAKAAHAFVRPFELKLLSALVEQLPDNSSNEQGAVTTATFCNSAQTCSGATAIAATSPTQTQNGATTSSSGSTSATQLPGIPTLLGLAVENGAITNNVSGNTMTLSTTLYSLVASFAGDSQKTYASCGHCTLLGGSATFNLTDTSDPLQQASRRQISQWQVKYTFRDLSSRSSLALTLYRNVGTAARAVVGQLSSPAFLPYFQQIEGKSLDTWLIQLTMKDIAARGVDTASLTDADWTDIGRAVLVEVEANDTLGKIFESAASNSALVDKTHLYAAATKTLLLQEKQYATNLTNLSNGWNGAASFGQQYPTTTITAGSATLTTPTYLAGGLILSYKPGPKASTALNPTSANDSASSLRPALTFNGGVTFYPKPVTSANEQTFRGGTAALQLQWSIDKRPFSHDPLDKSQTTVSLNGNYSRLQESQHQAGKKADIAVGNLKLEIPISSGISFPLSITIANASEQVKETYVRGNFGISFDLDKLSALLKARN